MHKPNDEELRELQRLLGMGKKQFQKFLTAETPERRINAYQKLKDLAGRLESLSDGSDDDDKEEDED